MARPMVNSSLPMLKAAALHYKGLGYDYGQETVTTASVAGCRRQIFSPGGNEVRAHPQFV
jgi:hypothetical protein